MHRDQEDYPLSNIGVSVSHDEKTEKVKVAPARYENHHAVQAVPTVKFGVTFPDGTRIAISTPLEKGAKWVGKIAAAFKEEGGNG